MSLAVTVGKGFSPDEASLEELLTKLPEANSLSFVGSWAGEELLQKVAEKTNTLQALSIGSYKLSKENLETFIRNNPGLESLKIFGDLYPLMHLQKVEEEDFSLLEELTELRELAIGYSDHLSCQKLNKIVEKCKNLAKVTIVCCDKINEKPNFPGRKLEVRHIPLEDQFRPVNSVRAKPIRRSATI